MHPTTTFLFDILTDPHEEHNLANATDHQDKLAELFQMLALARKEASPFEMDHDRAFDRDTRQRWCEAARDARGGFLGPYMEGKPATRTEYEDEIEANPRLRRVFGRRVAHPDEPADKVYTDTWSLGRTHTEHHDGGVAL